MLNGFSIKEEHVIIKKQKGGWNVKKFINFLKDEEGVTAIEYGLIAAGIGVAIAAIVVTVGNKLVSTFTYVSNQLTTP